MKIVVTTNDIKLQGVAAGLFLSRAFCGEKPREPVSGFGGAGSEEALRAFARR